MTNNAAKRRIWLTATAVIITVALLLSCALAAFFYTRTGGTGAGNVAEGEGADEVYGLGNRGYGTAMGEIPAGSVPISDERSFVNFVNGNAEYGYLTGNITITSKIKSNLTLETGRTLDGNGCSITATHHSQGLSANISKEGNRNHYVEKFGFSGNSTDAVSIGNSESAYGVSDIISVNYGTIKNLNFISNATQRVYISPFDGNVSMGGIAGINFGTIVNCTTNIQNGAYGFVGSQWYYQDNSYMWSPAGHYRLRGGTVSTQNLVAFGGIAGINKGSIYTAKVTQNRDMGVFLSQYYDQGLVPNDAILSGIVGGVAGLNDGGNIIGVDFYGGNCWLYNDNFHNSVSYTGAIVGMSNLSDSPVNYIVNAKSWTVAQGTVQNLTLSFDNNYSVKTTRRGTNGKIGERRTNGYDVSWVYNGSYAGEIGGIMTSSSALSENIVVYNSTSYSGRLNFGNPFTSNDLGQSQDVDGSVMPLFGYGTNNTNDYINEITSISTRFEGQRLDSNGTDLTSVGATVSYVWDAEQQSDGSWVSGLRQNIDFTNVSGINGATYYIYGTQSYVNGNASHSTGSPTYVSSNVTYGGLAAIPSAASSEIEYNYSILFRNFADTQAFDAFASVNAGTNFAYAFANALVLDRAHTLDNSYASARELRSWKTIEGGLNQITVTGLNNTAVSVDGINALSDFIAVNRGTIINLSIAYSVARGTISASGNTAYGFVAGVNYGTIAPATISTSAVELSGNSPTSLLYLGGAVGYNCGSMSDITQNVAGNMTVSGSAKQAFLGGVIGVNTGAGTLQTAVLNGSYDATVQATAGSTYGNYVGGFIGAGVNSGSVSTQGNVLTLTQTQADPFGDWLYASKMRVQTNANSYTGLFAGLITASPTYSASTNPYINGLVAAAPDLDEAVGWFSPTKGVMTLAGYAAGAAGASGKYVPTDLIRGQVYTVQDASDAFVSKILTDVYWAPTANIYRFTVTSRAYNTNWALTPYDSGYRNFVNYGSPLNSGETFDTAWTYENNNNGSYAYTFDAGLYVQNNDASSNPDYLAPVVGVELIYRMNLQSGVSAGDTTNADDALTLFLSGESAGFEHMNPNNGYKALCAGASGAYGDNSGDPWTVNGGRDIVFDKPYGLDGSHNGGMSVSITGDATSYAQVWDEASQSYAAAEFIAVNNSSINALKVTVNGNKTYSSADGLVYSHLVGVNNGTVSACTVTVNGNVSLSTAGAAVYGSLVGINNGTVSTSSATLSGSVGVSGGGISYAGGAVGINRGVADGIKVTFGGGAITLTDSGGVFAALGGVIGLQDSASLSDVQAAGYGGTLTVEGLGAAGGVIGAANAGGNGTTVVSGMVSAAQTTLANISNAVYGMELNADSGYKGLIAGSLGESAVRDGALSGVAAFYPDEVAAYAVPWTTTATGTISMYGYGGADPLEGILFKVSDYSNDGGAEYLTDRTISVNGAAKSFTFDISQIAGLTASSLTFAAKYYYYDSEGALTNDAAYTDVPSLGGAVCTTAINGTYAGGASYVPTLDVLIDYAVTLNNGENQQLVDFMRGASDSGFDSYAGARKANIVASAAFTLDSNTAALRGTTSGKGKELSGQSNTINISGTLPTATYDGETVAGGFFAVNEVKISGVSVATTSDLRPSGYAFGLLAGVNEGELTDVEANFTQNLNASVSVLGGLIGLNKGIIDGATVAMNGVSASYGDKIAFGSVAGVNTAAVSSSTATLAGTYTLTSASVYSGAAIGENSASLSDVTVTFADAALTANPTSAAYAGGVVGMQSGGSLTDVGTAGGSLKMSVASGSGYVGGIVGIINTGAGEQTVAGHSLSASSMSGVYAGAYTSATYGTVYKGLIAGAVGSIASGSIQGATAHYYENGYTPGDFTIPWFATDEGAVSMYGYNAAGADATYATGLLFKMSDYSDDGAADFVTGRTLSGSAGAAQIYFPISDFSGANSLSIAVDYVTWSGGVKSVTTLTTLTPTTDVTYGESRVNNGGDYVPTIDFFASYSVDITAGTEGDWQNAEGIANSLLFCFIDGVGENQLYAGAQVGNVTEDILVDKPMNGYVTMCEGKTLQGNGHTLNMSWVGDTTNGNFVLQQNDRKKDDAEAITSSGGGYVQVDAGGGTTGAIGGLIAVNYGNVNGFNVVHENNSATTAGYAFIAAADAAAGVLVGVNFGTVENVTYDDSTSGSTVKLFGQGGADVIFGGIVGVNAGDVSSLKLNGRSAVTVDGDGDAVYGGVLGANYGAAENIVLSDSGRNAIGQVGTGVYGGAVGANYGALNDVSVTVGTAIAESDYLSILKATPDNRRIYLSADDLSIWGGVLGYNSGTVNGATLIANVNYGMAAGAGHLSAGGVVGMNDGGSLSGLNATGWGGFFVASTGIMMTETKSVFVGGLVGSMNADGASQIGFISFENNTTSKATLTDGVFALSGGMVTMNSYSVGMTRYGYVTGVLAAVYGNIPEGAVTNTFWFIPDKLKSRSTAATLLIRLT